MTHQATWTQTLKAMAIEVVNEHSRGRDRLKCASILWTDFMVCLDFKGIFGKSFPFLFFFICHFVSYCCHAYPSLWAFLCLKVLTMSFDCSYIIGHMTLVATYVNSPWPATAHTLLFFLYILIPVTTQGIVLWGCFGRYFSIQADPIQILLPI